MPYCASVIPSAGATPGASEIRVAVDLEPRTISSGASDGAILNRRVMTAPVAPHSEAIDSPIKLGEDCLGRSDHEHFWEAGLPAAVLTDGTKYDGYPWYHEPGDTMDKVNIPYLRSMIQLTAAAAALLAAPESEGR